MKTELLICLDYAEERLRLVREFQNSGLPYQPVWEGRTADGLRQCYFRTDVPPLSHPNGNGIWLTELSGGRLSLEKQSMKLLFL